VCRGCGFRRKPWLYWLTWIRKSGKIDRGSVVCSGLVGFSDCEVWRCGESGIYTVSREFDIVNSFGGNTNECFLTLALTILGS
jgi:hypothetical protein